MLQDKINILHVFSFTVYLQRDGRSIFFFFSTIEARCSICQNSTREYYKMYLLMSLDQASECNRFGALTHTSTSLFPKALETLPIFYIFCFVLFLSLKSLWEKFASINCSVCGYNNTMAGWKFRDIFGALFLGDEMEGRGWNSEWKIIRKVLILIF